MKVGWVGKFPASEIEIDLREGMFAGHIYSDSRGCELLLRFECTLSEKLLSLEQLSVCFFCFLLWLSVTE